MAFGLYGLTDRSRIRGQSRKSVLFPFFDSFSLSTAKRLTIKAFLEVTLVSLTLGKRTVFKIFGKTQAISLYWFPAQQQTSTSRRQKLDSFYSNLVQNLIKLVSSSKNDRKWPKDG